MAIGAKPLPEPKKLLIVNLHSTCNLGDEGIQAATFMGLKQIFPDAAITAAADDPGSWRGYEHEHLTFIGGLCTWVGDCATGRWRQGLPRMPVVMVLLVVAALIYRLTGRRLLTQNGEWRRLLAAYYEADLVLTGGGGYIYAHHSPSPGFFWALMAILFPLALNKPVAMLPQSIGPITGRWQQALARQTLRRAPLIMLRELRSVRFLRDVLGVKNQVHVLPDLAFGLVDEALPARPEVASPSNLQIGVTVIDRAAQAQDFNNQAIYESALVETLAMLHETTGATLHLFVQCYGPSTEQDDRPATGRIFRNLRDRGIPIRLHADFQGYRAIREAFAAMDLLIATRMHSGIFALTAGVPVVMIAYQPKASGVMADFGLDDYCLDISDISSAQLIAVTRQALENRAVLSRHIPAHLSQMRPELDRWKHLLAEDVWRR